jgi:afadin
MPASVLQTQHHNNQTSSNGIKPGPVEDRRELIRVINEWNSSRYDLFALSQPTERLEFHGVMRFYFQDAGEKVSTKCIRVDSTASTEDVIKVLIEKFRPDMKSLSSWTDFAIYEVHADSQERKLDAHEKPLWVQLDWGKDGREGRFLLKNENAKTVPVEIEGMLRDKKRMSKRDKKKLQKQLKENAVAAGTGTVKENKLAEHLYKEVPDSNFTRSISNPEIVMARRRQQKLENKLKQIKNRDGGGTLKVYGETLKPDIPYKTLLMSNQDTAAFAVKETLEKYGLPNEDPDNYCLVQVGCTQCIK